MRLDFDIAIAEGYKSPVQKARVLTEAWVKREIFCPCCGLKIESYKNNKPVADFYCSRCKEDYELKSKKYSMGKKIVDGAYRTMIERLEGDKNPNFFFLNYINYEVINFVVIPGHFFVPEYIEKRKPLPSSARRAGWIGCNILLSNIPQGGRIFYVKGGIAEQKKTVLENWNKTLFLKDSRRSELKGWILDMMNCIDQVGKNDFTLDEAYSFEKILTKKHPNNKHVKDKIRQQLQYLRDKGYLEFVGRGKYRLR